MHRKQDNPKETAHNDRNKARVEMNLLDVPVDMIDWDGQSVREAQDDDHVVQLAMSIASHGLLNPITVRKKPDKRYQGCAGFHRHAAYVRLGRPTIPANVREEDNTPIKALALIENIMRLNMTLAEEVMAVNLLNTDENLSPSAICDISGKSRNWVDVRLSIPQMPEDVREELLDGGIGLKHAEIIGKIEDYGIRASILNNVIQNKLTAKQTGDLAEMYMATPSISAAIEAGLETAHEVQNAQTPKKQCTCCGQWYDYEFIIYIPVCKTCYTEITK